MDQQGTRESKVFKDSLVIRELLERKVTKVPQVLEEVLVQRVIGYVNNLILLHLRYLRIIALF